MYTNYLKMQDYSLFPFYYSDINECEDSNGGCEQLCVNFDGTFTCDCENGYALDEDGVSCIGNFSFLGVVLLHVLFNMK